MTEQLESAKQKAKLDQAEIDRQRLVIQNLTLTGSETADARSHLRTLEEAQDDLLADMMRILNTLDDLSRE